MRPDIRVAMPDIVNHQRALVDCIYNRIIDRRPFAIHDGIIPSIDSVQMQTAREEPALKRQRVGHMESLGIVTAGKLVISHRHDIFPPGRQVTARFVLFHFGNENYGGAKKLYESCRAKLEPYRSTPFMGLDVNAFLNSYEICFAELMNHT